MIDLQSTIESLSHRLNGVNVQIAAGLCAPESLKTLNVRLDELLSKAKRYKDDLLEELQYLNDSELKCDRILLAVDAVDEKRKGPTYDKNDKTSLKATTKKNKIGTDESISNNLKCLNSTSNSAPSSAKPADSRRIMSVDVTEFDSVPQYMRGRLTLERVNSAVEAINRVIDEKYSLLRMNPSKLSVEMRQRFFDLQASETNDVVGRTFVTKNDLINVSTTKTTSQISSSTFKMDPTGRAILGIMRHLGRIKEVHSPGNNVLYVII